MPRAEHMFYSGGGMPAEKRGRGGGGRQRCMGSPRRNAGNEKQGVWSVRDRGGGTSSPSLSAPPPMAISPRSSARGDPGEEPDTAAHQLHPGHGCSPDIATHGPRPQEGAGEERRRRGRGGGCRQKRMSIPCRRRGRGGGRRQRCMGSLPEKARAGRGCRQKRMGIPARARAG